AEPNARTNAAQREVRPPIIQGQLVSDLYRFHVNVFAAPPVGSFARTWEEAAAELTQVPRMIFEPDGSFVVSGDTEGRRWQVDGHLFDFDGRLQRVELHGDCPREDFDTLLQALGWPGRRVVFELVREGIRVEEAEFRH